MPLFAIKQQQIWEQQQQQQQQTSFDNHKIFLHFSIFWSSNNITPLSDILQILRKIFCLSYYTKEKKSFICYNNSDKLFFFEEGKHIYQTTAYQIFGKNFPFFFRCHVSSSIIQQFLIDYREKKKNATNINIKQHKIFLFLGYIPVSFCCCCCFFSFSFTPTIGK